jgi:hypothetical protein
MTSVRHGMLVVCCAFVLSACGADDRCYSPSSPPETLGGASPQGGCLCRTGTDADTCVRSGAGETVGMICTAGRWVAVADGPCGP